MAQIINHIVPNIDSIPLPSKSPASFSAISGLSVTGTTTVFTVMAFITPLYIALASYFSSPDTACTNSG